MAEYVIIKEIGKGSYGKVFLAKEKNSAESCKKLVIKEIDLRHASTKDRNAARQEAYLLRNIKHPNVISYRDSFEKSTGFLYIVMVFAEGGDLFKRIKSQRGLKQLNPLRKYVYLEEKQIVEWSVQIAMGLLYLHNKRVLHRDLKTQNIFLTNANLIKIGDLGIAKILDTNTMNETLPASTIIGTPYYMSPEIFNNLPYNEKSDMWSFGCCLYEMLTLRHAFHAKDINSLVYAVMKKSPPKVPTNLYSKELVEISKLFLDRNADRRPTANEFLKLPFIKTYIKMFLKNTQAKVEKKEEINRMQPIEKMQREQKIKEQKNPSSGSRSSSKSASRSRSRDKLESRPASKESHHVDSQSNKSSPSNSGELKKRAQWVKPAIDASVRPQQKHDLNDDLTIAVEKEDSIAQQSGLELPKIENLSMQKTKDSDVVPHPVNPVTSPHTPNSEHPIQANQPGFTLNSTTKLLDKIVNLRKKCLTLLGVKKLSQVYQIIDKFVGDDEFEILEASLKKFLGEQQFEEIGLDIWQLKFCEERLFC